jgi:hypothetical protein
VLRTPASGQAGSSLLGLILSIAGRRQAKRFGMATGLSTAGIVIGVISTVFGLLLVVAFLG